MMKHRVGYNRLGRKASHRKSLHRNMTTSLFRYERIKTTKAKALAIKRTAEKMITRAKEDSVHNRRMVGRDIKDQEILAKLFTDIGPRYKSRPGGYTRMLKLGHRQGDAAEMVLLELVVEEMESGQSGKKSKKTSKKSGEAKGGKKESKATQTAVADAETTESPELEEDSVHSAGEETSGEREAEAEDTSEAAETEEDSGEVEKKEE